MSEQHIGVCAILVNPQGEVLVGKRKNSYKAGLYGLPGGRVDVNERLDRAIQREVLEETGINIEYVSYQGIVRENQGEYDFIHFIFVVKDVTQVPELCEPNKCEGWEWVDVKKFDGEILDGHRAALGMFLNEGQLSDLTNN